MGWIDAGGDVARGVGKFLIDCVDGIFDKLDDVLINVVKPISNTTHQRHTHQRVDAVAKTTTKCPSIQIRGLSH